MNRILIKNVIVLSLILGSILGLLAPIPIVGIFMLFGILLLAAPLVMVYLIMDGKLELTTPTDSIITGALVGFSANMSFASAFCIMIFILSQFFNFNQNLFLTAMIVNSPIWLLGVFIIFLGILIATTNAFTGFGTFYVINFIRDMYEKKYFNDKNLK
ncbi:hypothetical protein HDR58_06245 [bacterium]|nr:hypothetical protein [bacterium]